MDETFTANSMDLINPSSFSTDNELNLPPLSESNHLISSSFYTSYLGSWSKRSFDLFVCVVAILVLAPLLVLIAVSIICTSPGPVIYRQRRFGKDFAEFNIFKFRTMYSSDCETSFVQAKYGDTRITNIGKLLRKTSIDELPQLFNVLRGEMSIVGPRPHPIDLDMAFRDKVDGYMDRSKMLPGMTGFAQTRGARGETPTVKHMQRRIRLDCDYLLQASFKTDLGIILATIREVTWSRNAY